MRVSLEDFTALSPEAQAKVTHIDMSIDKACELGQRPDQYQGIPWELDARGYLVKGPSR